MTSEKIGRGSAGLAGRVHACLLGGAIGDSLGAEIEFWPLERIRRTFPHGFADLPPHDGVAGAITDDTQMTLFTAEGLLREAVRSASKGICHPPAVVHHALLRWFVTQGGRPALEVDTGGLVSDRRLHRRRAPGLTCLSALGEARRLGVPARNGSKGCGTIMRVSSLAFLDRGTVRELAVATSALTHGHPTGQEAAAAWALILNALAVEPDIERAAGLCLGSFGAETDAAIRRALAAPRDGRPETVETLGGGWTAEEALSIALYACLCAEDPERGLVIAVTHPGDSDSTGAIAGNALGLIFPDQILAHRWAGQVECADLIARIADDLAFALTGIPRNCGTTILAGEGWTESPTVSGGRACRGGAGATR